MRSLRLIPNTVPFFDMLKTSADLNLAGARILAEIVGGSADIDRKARELKDLEHRADENTHEIFRALNVTFVTPLDREDLSALASALDDVIDWIEEASRRIRLYKMADTGDLGRRFAAIVVEQATLLSAAIPLLDKQRSSPELERTTREIHRLENEADDVHADALAHLYDGVTEVQQLIKATRLGDIYSVLETATDKAEHVAVVIGNISIKHG